MGGKSDEEMVAMTGLKDGPGNIEEEQDDEKVH